AEALSVSESWVRRVKPRRREYGERGPRPRGGSRGVKLDRARLAALVADQPDATLSELRARLAVPVARSTICEALKELKLSYKKRRSTPPSRTGPMSPSVGPHGG
ncbi:MAG: transposase, partial [Planctomycetota bacterium]